MQPLGHHCEQIRNVSTATDSVWMTGQKISDPENQTLVDQMSTFPGQVHFSHSIQEAFIDENVKVFSIFLN